MYNSDYKSFWKTVDVEEVLKSAKTMLNFAENVPSGDSYWIDAEGASCPIMRRTKNYRRLY